MIDKNDIGGKIYKTSLLPIIRIIIFIIFLFLLAQFFLETFYIEGFTGETFKDVVDYHLMYPHELIVFCLAVVAPTIYYGLFRGTVFCDNGILINRGLPFFNHKIFYQEISSYKVVHPKFLIMLHRKETGDEILLSVSDIERVLSILDQNFILGELGENEFSKAIDGHKNFLFVLAFFAVTIFVVQHFGLFRLFFN
jgi:hypothetical protein